MVLKRNLIANFLGQGWTALMSLAFIPLYIKYLGMEAYGLIGLFALLQAWMTLLDMGMTPTLNREMARFVGGVHSAEGIRDLLRSIEVVAIVIAILTVASVWAVSGRLASDWLRAERLSDVAVAQAFTLMGAVTGLRFVESIFRSCIVGLQRQVLLNFVTSIMATLRGVGAVAILIWVSPTIEAFFIWQGVISLATLATFVAATYATLPTGGRRGRFSLRALAGVARFAGGMVSITLLSLLLIQVDKVLLSKLLTLSEYGYYTLAAVVAGALNNLVGPITQAWFPRLAELHALNDSRRFIDTYHHGAQMVSVVMGSAAVILIIFSQPLLTLWTQDPDLASRAARFVSLLALGNLLHGLMRIPYASQLAYGWTSLAVQINIVAVLVIVPAILWATPRYGAEGAAWVWVGLNLGYLLIAVHFMYRKILVTEKWRWYAQDILQPLLAAVCAAMLVKWVFPTSTLPVSQIARIAVASVLAFAAAAIGAPLLRRQLKDRLLACHFVRPTNHA